MKTLFFCSSFIIVIILWNPLKWFNTNKVLIEIYTHSIPVYVRVYTYITNIKIWDS